MHRHRRSKLPIHRIIVAFGLSRLATNWNPFAWVIDAGQSAVNIEQKIQDFVIGEILKAVGLVESDISDLFTWTSNGLTSVAHQ